jgi:1,2-diacylglycerol 3-alpha-glucosyltransferase
LRIGLLTDGYKPATNGVIRFVSLHKRMLESLGHEAFVFTWGSRDPGDGPGVIRSPGLRFVKPGYYISTGYSRQAQSVLETLDLLHTNQPLLSGAMALRYGRRYDLPIVLTCHSRYDLLGINRLPFMPLDLYRALVRPYLRWCTDRCDLVTVSTPVAAQVMRSLGVACPIEVIPFGVELDCYHDLETRLTRSDLGLPDSVPLALFVGRLAPEKNVLFLLQALARSELEHAYLLIVGTGDLRDDLEAHARALGVDSRVCFAGEAAPADMPLYASLADLFVTASEVETFSFAVVEGVAAGLPVVGMDMPWIRHVVRHGANGLLATAGSVESFAQAWATLLDDGALRARLADGARATSKKYDVRRTTMLMVAHYEQLLQAHRGGGG